MTFEEANPKMQALPSSPKEKSQDRSPQPMLSSPLTGACPSKMSKVNTSLSTPDDSRASMGLNEPRGLKNLDNPNQEGSWDQLYTSLRALVNKVVSQLRKSISDQMLDSFPTSFKTNPSSSLGVKSRAKTTLLGEETVSFLLPQDCLVGVNMDKNIQHQSLFEGRLRGWHIACRQRENGKIDMTYRHGQSRRMFRSTIEVVKFIMEVLNAGETTGIYSLLEKGLATSMKGSSKKRVSFLEKEKIPPSKSLKISHAKKITVERFLEESYNNLKKIYDNRWVTPESEDWEKYLKATTEKEADGSSDEETL